MLKIRVVEIFAGLTALFKVRVVVIVISINSCVKGQCSCNLYKD